MQFYTDYIQINRDFIPVFSQDADVANPNSWKSFIPHQRFRDILECLIVSLERGKPSNKLSLWLQGAYGTGKTYAVFVLKHLIEDPLPEVEAYFQNSDVLRSLWPRLKALRERGEYLVAFTSSAQHITSSLRLFLEVQKTIKQRLRERYPEASAAPTLLDALISKIADPDSSFDWSKAFERHRGLFLQEKSSKSVIDKLRNGDLDVAARVEDVLEREGVVVTGNAQDLKRWIKDTIEQAKLSGILFIWDEFTDFFNKNDQVSDLQELAHSTTDMPFYLFLVTHRNLEQYKRIDEATRKKIGDRFHQLRFDLHSITAYNLLGHAICATPESSEDLKSRRMALWSRVGKSAETLLTEEVRKEDFIRLLPLHPFTAYLLAKISSQFSSSQRTLFRFLKDDSSPYSFAAFLANHPNDGWDLLTADRLWDYFFQDDDSELAEKTRDVAGYCRSRLHAIESNNETLVFKAVMLLEALWREAQGDQTLRPTRVNIQLLFLGTPISENISTLLTSLCDQGTLNATGYKPNNSQYVIPLHQLSREKLDEIKSQQPKFAEMIASGEGKILLQGLFAPKDSYGEVRFQISSIAIESLRLKRERIEPTLKAYQIGIILVACLTEDEFPEVQQICSELSNNITQCAFVALHEPLGNRRYKEWVEERALSDYSRGQQDIQNAAYHHKRAINVLTEWGNLLQNSRNIIYFRNSTVEFTDLVGYRRQQHGLIEISFPYGPEKLTQLSTLFKLSGWSHQAAEVGLGIAQKVSLQFEGLLRTLTDFERQNGYIIDQNHPLSRIKSDLDNFFKRDSVRLVDIWQHLQASPYGFSPTVGCATIFGFLLKGYSQGYYWADSANCHALNPNKLAELIKAVMKEERDSGYIEIRKIAPELEALCQLVTEIFRLPAERSVYPEETRKALCKLQTENGYPLFILSWTNTLSGRPLESLPLLHDWITKTDSESLSREEGKNIVAKLEREKHDLMAMADPASGSYAHGMERFIDEAAPGLLNIASAMKIDTIALMRMIREQQRQEIWLWQESDLRKTLPIVHIELTITDSLNQLCRTHKQTLRDAIVYCEKTWLRNLTSLPLPVLCEHALLPLSRQIAILLSAESNDWLQVFTASEIEQIKTDRESIHADFAHPQYPLKEWIKTQLARDIDEVKVIELLARLPLNFSQLLDVQEINHELRLLLSDLSKTNKIQEIRALWEEISGSKSPRDWSHANLMPIQWVLEGVKLAKLIGALNSLDHLSEDSLQATLDLLNSNRDSLGILKDKKSIDVKFINAAAGSYQTLLTQSGTDKLRNFLSKKLHHPADWPNILGEVQQQTKFWIDTHYRDEHFHEISAFIKALTPDQAKDLLIQLTTDPIVGAQMLNIQLIKGELE